MQLLFHSILQMLRHFIALIAYSWVLPLLLFGIGYLLIPSRGNPLGPFEFFVLLGLSIVYFIMSLAVAVAWYRRVLLGPQTVAQRGETNPVCAYLGWGLLIGFVVAVFTFLLVFGLSSLLDALFNVRLMSMSARGWSFYPNIGLLTLPITVLMGWLMLRFSLILPAIAIGYPLKILQAFKLSGSIRGELFVFALIVAVANYGFGFLNAQADIGMTWIIVNALLNWLWTMLYLSGLNTMFRVLVPPVPARLDI